jgi:hypothetical protein
LPLFTGQRIHVWNPLPRLIVTLIVLPIPMILVIGYFSWTNGPFYIEPGCHGKGCTPPVLYLVLGLTLAAGLIHDMIRSNKLEFYDTFLRIKGRGAQDREYVYSDLGIGSLVKQAFSYYFFIYVKGGPYKFHVKNALLAGESSKSVPEARTLYDWIRLTEVEREKLVPEVVQAEKIKSMLRFITPAGLLIVLAMTVVAYFGYEGDDSIFLGLGAVILLLFIVLFRGIQNERATGT